MQIVTIWKRKRPAGCGRWRAYDLATDAYGTWLYTPAHSTFVATSGEDEVGTCEVAQDYRGRGRHCVVLLPATKWFVAHWVLDSQYAVNIDISTPPARSGANWLFDDLELDPFVLRDGSFGVEDEDEFTAACAAGLITASERDAARRTVDELRTTVAGASPLLQTGRQHLDDAVAMNLNPLTPLPGGPSPALNT